MIAEQYPHVDHGYSLEHNRDSKINDARDKARQNHRKWRQNKKDAMEKILRENADLKSENQSLNEKILQ